MIHDLTWASDSAYLYSEHPALSVRVLDTTAVPSDDEDGYFLRVSVLNSLPCVSAYLVLESVFYLIMAT